MAPPDSRRNAHFAVVAMPRPRAWHRDQHDGVHLVRSHLYSLAGCSRSGQDSQSFSDSTVRRARNDISYPDLRATRKTSIPSLERSHAASIVSRSQYFVASYQPTLFCWEVYPLVMRRCISHDMHIRGLWHLISTDPESAWDRDSFRGAVRGRGSGSRLRLIFLHLPWQEFPIACLSFCAVACAPPS